MHHLLLDGIGRDEAVYVHGSGLADTVRTVHRLEVDEGIPVRFKENDLVRRFCPLN
jgi:hypothetical protein